MAEIPIIKTDSATTWTLLVNLRMQSGLQSQNQKTSGTFSTSWSVSRPKSSAVKNIDIGVADILESEISVNIDILLQLYSQHSWPELRTRVGLTGIVQFHWILEFITEFYFIGITYRILHFA